MSTINIDIAEDNTTVLSGDNTINVTHENGTINVDTSEESITVVSGDNTIEITQEVSTIEVIQEGGTIEITTEAQGPAGEDGPPGDPGV